MVNFQHPLVRKCKIKLEKGETDMGVDVQKELRIVSDVILKILKGNCL